MRAYRRRNNGGSCETPIKLRDAIVPDMPGAYDLGYLTRSGAWVSRWSGRTHESVQKRVLMHLLVDDMSAVAEDLYIKLRPW